MADTPNPENPQEADPIDLEALRALPGPCPTCQLEMPGDQIEAHLRTVHRLFAFQNSLRSFDATWSAALAALAGPARDQEAWKVLVELAKEQHDSRAFSFLATAVTQALHQVPSKSRSRAISNVGSVVARAPEARDFLKWLAAEDQVTAHRLTLAIVARIGFDLAPDEVRRCLPLLRHKSLSTREAVTAAAKLLQILRKEESSVALACEALAKGRKRRRAIARLTLLENRIGPSASLSAVRRRLINQTRMRCPKCAVKLSRSEMLVHLWQEHQLILHADKARKPWKLLEKWIAAHGEEQNGILLEKCRSLVAVMEPATGRMRLERMILANGVDDVEARRFLLRQAVEAHACVCPHCFALVPRPWSASVNRLVVGHGRLGYLGYSVEIRETSLFPHLLVRTPHQVIFTGREPNSRMTWVGTLLAITPLIMAAFAIGSGLVSLGIRVFFPVSFLLLVALVLAMRDRSERRKLVKPAIRALGYAWERLVPVLHTPGFNESDAAFLSGLAVLTATRESFHVPEPVLARCLAETDKAVTSGSAESVYLAALQRLAIARQAHEGEDPIAEVAKQIGRCFDGPLSLSYAEELIAGWKTGWLNPSAWARLRVLVCDKAFEAGFELASLRHAIRQKPTLRDLLNLKDLRALAQLRLLWSQRPRRPWDRHGKAVTAFELAQEEKSDKWLGRYADLLLLVDLDTEFFAQSARKSSSELRLVLCSRGVALQGKIIMENPPHLEVVRRKLWEGSGYDLIAGSTSFHFEEDPQDLVSQIERWCRFYFLEFRPQAEDVVHWKAPDTPARMRARGAVECSECHGWMLPRIGEVGVPVDDPDPITLEIIQ
ncbi:MAG: hypothetical protein ACJ8FY_10135 [Gemmataceae bacterium]